MKLKDLRAKIEASLSDTALPEGFDIYKLFQEAMGAMEEHREICEDCGKKLRKNTNNMYLTSTGWWLHLHKKCMKDYFEKTGLHLVEAPYFTNK